MRKRTARTVQGSARAAARTLIITPLLLAAAPASAVTSRTAPVEVTCSSGDEQLARELEPAISQALASRESLTSVVLYDRVADVTCLQNDVRRQDAASVVKPIILGALLFEHGGDLTEEEKSLAEKMITSSDNSATDVLWERLSHPKDPSHPGPDPVKVQDFLDASRMNDTVLDKEGLWGLTQVTARDQAKLLQLFTGQDDAVLDAASRAYALDLLNTVQDDQRWGVPEGAPEEAVVHVKNGWLQRSENADRVFDRLDWKVNSMGAFTHPEGRFDYGIVVLSENNRPPAGSAAESGWDYGIGTVEGVARAINGVLRAHHAGPDAG